MIPDGTYTAVVDRIEDSLATVQVEGDDDLYDFVVDEGELPREARHANAVLHVEVTDEELTDVAYDETETRGRTEQAQNRFDSLSKRPRRDDSEDAS